MRRQATKSANYTKIHCRSLIGKRRAKQHENIGIQNIHSTKKRRSIQSLNIINYKNKTTLKEDFEKCKHPIIFDDVRILAKQNSYKKRVINEITEIKNKLIVSQKNSASHNNILKSNGLTVK